MNWTAMVGDCRALPLPDESVEAVVTDPPYGISFMGREWDHDVPGPEYWREVKRVMKPGAHLLAFGGTRTWHWLTVGIEEAGFEVRDCLSWMYGTGFPKSHDISKAIDEKAGAERDELGVRQYAGGHVQRSSDEHLNPPIGTFERPQDDRIETAPATVQAERWDGWGTALKPAWEPIVLAMKPTGGTFAENALEHGVAGLNIDGCRISTGSRPWRENTDDPNDGVAMEGNVDGSLGGSRAVAPTSDGRWPANVTLSHTRWCRKVGTKRVEGTKPTGEDGEVNVGFGDEGREREYTISYADEDGMEEVDDWDCPPCCPVRQLDEESGAVSYNPSGEFAPEAYKRRNNVFGEDHDPHAPFGYGDTGGPSRFYYCAKASRSEREAGLPDVEGRANQHPTVKPVDLCKWLVRLVTRPEHTVLDPFMGSGSIGCAVVQECRNYIGLDLEPEYVEVARQRIEHFTPKQRELFTMQGVSRE